MKNIRHLPRISCSGTRARRCRIFSAVAAVVVIGGLADNSWSAESGKAASSPETTGRPIITEGLCDTLSNVCRHADNLIEHARDHYGPKSTPLFVCQLDIVAKTLLPPDTHLYACEKRGGAGPSMNNLEFDSGRLRLLYALSQITGEVKYARAADEYLGYYLAHLPDLKTGFFPWGDHMGYDVTRDETIRERHEMKVAYFPWEQMYRVNPQAVQRQIQALRKHIIDEKKSYGFNRHCPTGSVPHSMNSSGGAYLVAWAFLYKKTGDAKYLEWAQRMDDYLWGLRDPSTDLLAAHPFDPAYPATQSPRTVRTEYLGPMTWYASNLLHAWRLLGEREGATLRNHALAYIRAFTRRMDIQPDGSFYATFELATGKPLFPRITDPWKHTPQESPGGWANGVQGLRAHASLAFAYKVTRQPDLRDTFDKLVPLLEVEKFTRTDGKPEPVSAGSIAQAIVAFLNMYQAGGEQSYLRQAQVFGRYATAHYYKDGWFVCGLPTVPRYRDPKVDVWHTYSNRGGSDDLALALLRLDLAVRGRPDPVDDDPISHF